MGLSGHNGVLIFVNTPCLGEDATMKMVSSPLHLYQGRMMLYMLMFLLVCSESHFTDKENEAKIKELTRLS